MGKNVLIILLIAVCAVEGYMLYQKKFQPMVVSSREEQTAVRPSGTPPRIPLLKKGDNFNDSPIKKFAYQIAPGPLSSETKQALVGFQIDSQVQTDGSIVVKLTPKDSDDQNQQYMVKKGEILYFIEMTPVDDKRDQDKDLNLRDDYGVITDANGIVQ